MRRGFLLSGALALSAFALIIAMFAFSSVQLDMGSASMTGYAVEAARYPSDLANYTCSHRGTDPGGAYEAATNVFKYSFTNNETLGATKLGQTSINVKYVKNHPPASWFDTDLLGDGDGISGSRQDFDFAWFFCEPDDDEVLHSILYSDYGANCQSGSMSGCSWALLGSNYYHFSTDFGTLSGIDLTALPGCGSDCTINFRVDTWDGEYNGTGYSFNHRVWDGS